MSTQHRRRPKPTSVEGEEEKAWIAFYRRAPNDPALAAEVLAQLNSDNAMKHDRLALFLCCKESIRKEKARQARNQRIGAFVRKLAGWLFVFPCNALRHMGRGSRDIVIDMLPEVERPIRPALKSHATSSHDALPVGSTVPAVIRSRERPPLQEPTPVSGTIESIPS
ncbi:MAG: hypothetical protein FWD67_11990 [Betaproteobacteria bacterium]|nr:hypothetical protein [Betaproteobacteria bacterium]